MGDAGWARVGVWHDGVFLAVRFLVDGAAGLEGRGYPAVFHTEFEEIGRRDDAGSERHRVSYRDWISLERWPVLCIVFLWAVLYVTGLDSRIVLIIRLLWSTPYSSYLPNVITQDAWGRG